MMSGLIRFEGVEYKVRGDGRCILSDMTEDCGHFIVPSAISTSEGKSYRVTGILSTKYYVKGSANMISFDESSEITKVPFWFIGCCRSTFILPRNVKRVTGCPYYFPKIVSEKGFQRFVSTPGSRMIMRHFPLEVAYQHSHRQHFIIRESVRFVGGYSSYGNEIITSVVFPSSVEYIGDYSFSGCKNLRYFRFKKNSRLKIIGNSSFKSTSLESVEIPSNVEEIRNEAFVYCASLKSVTFHEDSKLKIIGNSSFNSTSLESIKIPSNVEEIGNYAFMQCWSLKSVTFHEDSKLKIIGECSFAATPLKSVEIPSNVEEIRYGAFIKCMSLRSVRYLNEEKIRKIEEGVFDNCPNSLIIHKCKSHIYEFINKKQTDDKSNEKKEVRKKLERQVSLSQIESKTNSKKETFD